MARIKKLKKLTEEELLQKIKDSSICFKHEDETYYIPSNYIFPLGGLKLVSKTIYKFIEERTRG